MHLKAAIKKQAGSERIGDAVLGGIGSNLAGALIPGGALIGTGGNLAGLLEDDAKKALKGRGSTAKSIIPGVGPYRQGAVARAVADESGDRGRKQLLHELLGANVSTLGGAAAGATLGAGAGVLSAGALDGGYHNAGEGAILGALVGGLGGAIAPQLAGALLAAVKKTRTKKEQDEAEKENLAGNYMPGVGIYDYYKRLGSGYDRYFESGDKINKNAGDKSMGHLTSALSSITTEPRKQAVRDILHKQAEEAEGLRKQAVRNYIEKLAGPTGRAVPAVKPAVKQKNFGTPAATNVFGMDGIRRRLAANKAKRQATAKTQDVAEDTKAGTRGAIASLSQ